MRTSRKSDALASSKALRSTSSLPLHLDANWIRAIETLLHSHVRIAPSKMRGVKDTVITYARKLLLVAVLEGDYDAPYVIVML
jgi:hypothetical protein